MDTANYTNLIKVLELGEHAFLDIEDGAPEIRTLINEVFLNFVLTNLNGNQRTTLYGMLSSQSNPQEIYNFLLESVPDFENKLIERFKDEFQMLLTKSL